MGIIARRSSQIRTNGDITDYIIANSHLWLDGKDDSTFTLTGSDVDQWADKSLQGNDANNATNKPIRGADHVYFAGDVNNRGLILDSLITLTEFYDVFLVENIITLGTVGYTLHYDEGGAVEGFSILNSSDKYRRVSGAVVSGTLDSPLVSLSTKQLFNFYKENPNWSGYVIDNLGIQNVGFRTDRSDLSPEWNCYELIIFPFQLTTAKRTEVINYLNSKHSL